MKREGVEEEEKQSERRVKAEGKKGGRRVKEVGKESGSKLHSLIPHYPRLRKPGFSVVVGYGCSLWLL